MEIDMNYLPTNLIDFLQSHSGEPVLFDRSLQPDLEIDTVEFYSPSELAVSNYTVDSYEYFLNYNEFDEDPGLRYEIPGVDLIKRCNDYSPEGLLVFFPAFSGFGSWDGDHRLIRTFVHFSLPIQEPSLAACVNAQWYPNYATSELLRPWDDSRCEDFAIAAS